MILQIPEGGTQGREGATLCLSLAFWRSGFMSQEMVEAPTPWVFPQESLGLKFRLGGVGGNGETLSDSFPPTSTAALAAARKFSYLLGGQDSVPSYDCP